MNRSRLTRKLVMLTILVFLAVSALVACGTRITSYSFTNQQFAFVNIKGNLISWPKGLEAVTGFHEGFAVYKTRYDISPKSAGLIGLDGIPHPMPYSFSSQSLFSDGLALVRDPKSKKYIYVNAEGQKKIELDETNCGSCHHFSEGLAAVFWQDKNPANRVPSSAPSPNTTTAGRHLWGFIDKTGRFVIPPKFSSVSNFSCGRALVTLPNSHARIVVMDQPGTATFRSVHDEPGDYSKDSAGRIIVIDRSGTAIFQSLHDELGDYSKDGIAIFRNKKTDGSCYSSGLIDRNGTVILNDVFFQNFNDGLGLSSTELTEPLIYKDAKGLKCLQIDRKRLKNIFRSDDPCFSDGLAAMVIGRYPQGRGKKRELYAQKGFEFIDKRGKSLVIRTNGKVITSAFPFSDGYAVVELSEIKSKEEETW